MKRIIDMLLKMIWPAIVLFIVLLVEIFVLDESVSIIHKTAEGNTVTKIVVPIDELRMGIREGIKGITIFAVVVFSLMFTVGFVWNIVYSLKHKDE